VRHIILAVFGIAILSSPCAAESPYENAAKVDIDNLASSILAASLCKGVQFHSDAVTMSVAAAMVLIGRKGAEDAFFSAIRANIDDMSAKGREAWCYTRAPAYVTRVRLAFPRNLPERVEVQCAYSLALYFHAFPSPAPALPAPPAIAASPSSALRPSSLSIRVRTRSACASA
jgi:hypothetical protein